MASLKISLLEEMFESRLLMFSGMFFFNAGGMITLLVDVQQFIVGFQPPTKQPTKKARERPKRNSRGQAHLF